MPKGFDPSLSEGGGWEAVWQRHLSHAPAPSAAPYTVLFPPPNVTGALHLGHALTLTIQDALVRWRRMSGDAVLFIPGLDHAGIATQSLVERRLRERGRLASSAAVAGAAPPVTTRESLGREAFVAEVHAWADTCGARIRGQLRRLGGSFDWDREYYTMDAPRSAAVTEAFVRLAEGGLLSRRARLVHWCPALRTALSDIEVDAVAVEGPTKRAVPGRARAVEVGVLHVVAYPLVRRPRGAAAAGADEAAFVPLVPPPPKASGSVRGEGDTTPPGPPPSAKTHIFVATTRPETIIGDVAIAVHPSDARFAHLLSGGELESGPEVAAQTFLAEDKATRSLRGEQCAAKVVASAAPASPLPLSPLSPFQWFARNPLTGALLPIIGDGEIADPALGSGAVKVTPAHDAADWACAQRHGLPVAAMLDEAGRVVAPGSPFHGLDRWDAREGVLGALRGGGLLLESRPHAMVLSVCSRTGDVVEPMLAPQWYIACGDMGARAVEAWRGGSSGSSDRSMRDAAAVAAMTDVATMPSSDLAAATRRGGVIHHQERLSFFPPVHGDEWERWLGRVQDWCVSRQLWWGHRVPAWRWVASGASGGSMGGDPEDESAAVMDPRGAAAGLGETTHLRLRSFITSPHPAVVVDEGVAGGPAGAGAIWVIARSEAKARSRLSLACGGGARGDALASSATLEQDPDVLDTWFSSGLLPLSALGWPGPIETTVSRNGGGSGGGSVAEAPSRYPLALMETGGDILFFWVARMVMLCSQLQRGAGGSVGAASNGFSESDSDGRRTATSTATVVTSETAKDGGVSPSTARAAPLPQLPFPKVFLHPLVRDKSGRKMSKSLGNVVDPMHLLDGAPLSALLAQLEGGNLAPGEVKRAAQALRHDYPEGIAPFGADALRLALAQHMRGHGGSAPRGGALNAGVNLDTRRVQSARLFANKLWNAARFVLGAAGAPAAQVPGRPLRVDAHTDGCCSTSFVDSLLLLGEERGREEGSQPGASSPRQAPLPRLAVPEQWILSRLQSTCDAVHVALEGLDVGGAAWALHDFVLHDFCDVYIEWAKGPFLAPAASPGDGEASSAANAAQLRPPPVVARVLHHCLDMSLRLFHPFMPFVTEDFGHSWSADSGALETMRQFMDVVGGARSLRKTMLDVLGGAAGSSFDAKALRYCLYLERPKEGQSPSVAAADELALSVKAYASELTAQFHSSATHLNVIAGASEELAQARQRAPAALSLAISDAATLSIAFPSGVEVGGAVLRELARLEKRLAKRLHEGARLQQRAGDAAYASVPLHVRETEVALAAEVAADVKILTSTIAQLKILI